MNIKSLNDLYLHELERTYAAEKQIATTMPALAASVIGGDSQPVDRYVVATRERINRLEAIFKTARHVPGSARCRAMDGILADAGELIGAVGDHDARVSALLAAMQIVRHDLLARYATLAAWATTLRKSDEAKLLLGAIDERLAPSQPATVAGNQPETVETKSIGMGERLTALLDRKK